jgi:aminomethyltransferase
MVDGSARSLLFIGLALIGVPLMTDALATPLLKTPLHAMHVAAGARMVPFAGYDMPVSYPKGIMAEHAHTRSSAGLFDVSHMGQVRLVGARSAQALETLVPVDVMGLAEGRQRYAMFTNDQGGILDDLMVAKRAEDLLLVVNAACKQADIEHLQKHLGHVCRVEPLPDRALLALQGPLAGAVGARMDASLGALKFMDTATVRIAGVECFVSRSGYTGEDGFEMSMASADAERVAQALLAQPEVAWVGLGARDTLRLEAGLCLYGHDIDAQTTPIEASLNWAIQKVRRPGGARAGGYPGASTIESQLATGALIQRVGLVGTDRVPVREGASLSSGDARAVGRVTSGTVSPSLGKPIAMAYVARNLASVDTALSADVRGKPQPMRVTPMPFVPHRYLR